MSGILFLLEIIAFVIVAYWAYANDRAGPEAGGKGILKMTTVAAAASAAVAKRTPKWKKNHAVEAAELAEDPILRRSQPKWKRGLRTKP